MDLGITGNAALLTASSSGLGKAAAIELGRNGADVLINGRDEDRLAKAAADVEHEASGDVVAHSADLTNKRDIEGLVQRALDEFGRLDHVVTSAGGPPPLTPLETADDDWYQAYDLLVMSVLRVVRAAADPLQAGDGGSLVTITSRSVKEPAVGNTLSSCVRMPVVGLVKTLSQELAPAVRANSLLPGAFDTPRLRSFYDDAVERGEYESREAAYRRNGESIPVGRIGRPEEFGKTVAFLSSPASGFINGRAIVIDGGKVGSIW